MRRRSRHLALSVAALLLGGVVFVLLPEISQPLLQHPLLTLRLWRAPMPRGLPVPVSGVAARQLADTWGAPRSGGRHHQGIDIFARRGTAVTSATAGIVVRVGENRLGGRIVMIAGPAMAWHYYAHLDRFADLHVGDIVQPGTIVGYVGTTGNARGTPPHLHYGIYLAPGRAINPYPLLARTAS